MERVTFQTSDGVTVVGDYQEGSSGRAVLFLHMMPATRSSWAELADRLNALGFSTLAIDMRGHGESVAGPRGTTLDRSAFTDEQHQQKMLDVEAAMLFLMERGTPPARIAIAGASIGANLAIAYAGAHEEVPAAVALSPGLDYHGVRTEEFASRMPRAQKLLLVASAEDEYSFDSVKQLSALKEAGELQLLDGGGHGTAILKNVAGFLDYVVAWIDSNVKRL